MLRLLRLIQAWLQTLAILRYNRRMSKDTNHQVKVTESKDGSVKITQPKGVHRGVTVLLEQPDEVVRESVGGFVTFLKEKAVVGLAVGFIIGQQAQGLIKQLVDSFITPWINIIIGSELPKRATVFGGQQFAWGKFLYILINFIAVLVAVYAMVRIFKLDKLDTKPVKKKKS